MYTAWELCENIGYIVKIMDFMLFIVIFMSSVVYADGCRFGSGPNCAFPCNCNTYTIDGCDQETGDCTDYGGCKSSSPSDYGWGGPGCLVGNIAYKKSSSQSSTINSKHSASHGNDGANTCGVNTYTHTTVENPAWYKVDLGGRYRVSNVTVYDRTDYDSDRLLNSKIQIIDGNTIQECGTVAKTASIHTFTCNMVGDAVRIYRDIDNSIIHICELVVIGHPYVASISECQEWENDVVGCKRCNAGQKLPDCMNDCQSGYYGVNCQYQCSNNCKAGASPVCDLVSGRCIYGCDGWYVGDKCDLQIAEVQIHDTDVSVTSTSSSITVTWKAATAPEPGTMDYYHYNIKYHSVTSGGSDVYTPAITLVDANASPQSYTISKLQHNTEYAYNVQIIRTVGDLSVPYSASSRTIKTKCIAPSLPKMITLTAKPTGGEFSITWEEGLMTLNSGCDTMTMRIEYKYSSDGRWESITMSGNLTEYNIPSNGNKQCWANMIFENNEMLNTTKELYASYTPTTTTTVITAQSPTADKVKGTESPVSSGMIAGVAIAAVVFVVLVVLVVLLFLRYRRSLPVLNRKKEKESKQKLTIDVKFETGKSVTPMGDVSIIPGPAPPSSPKPKPISPRPQAAAKPVVQVNTSIPVSQLGSYIAKKRKERDGFKNEYSTLPEDETAPCERGSLPENKTKNRFLNIRAYDHSRVILETENADPFSDYINCNYIPGFDGNKEHYIAGQGPKPHNIVDLWRMIWQKKINRIAMMTNEIENSRRKCDRYWPENVEGSQQYGAITVTTMGIERFPFYTIRLLRVQKDGVSRSVRQFHFTAWIDKRIPEYAFPLLGFRKKVRMYDKQSTGPLFVHCSAGVGRTGTFIAIDYLLEQAKHKHTIDVRKWVNTMRGCRINMIQTLEQYIFVYDTLQEALACGDTSIPASELETTLKQLKVKQKGEKISPLEAQYKVIDDFRPVPKGEDFKALSEDNIHKNRDPNIYPSDLARPYLLTKSENGNDYINAVFVHGYNRSNHYLITQMPLPATAVDFWRMVCDIDIVTIVALNEINDEDCTPYWPDENDSTETYGPIEVSFKSSQDDEIASVSTFEITNNENGGRKKEVEHIRMLNWPDNTLPDPKNLIHVVNLLEQRAQLHNEGNVVIHCLKGVSNSGILVAALNMIEKLKIDQEIDVFTAVKAIRINRNMFIESFEQYEYLYQVAQTYKAMNDTYANFS